MTDTSKLPIIRVDGLNDILNSKSNYIIKNQNTDFDTLIETGLYYVPVTEGNIDNVHYPTENNSTVWFITVHTQKSTLTKKAIWQYAHSQNSFNVISKGTNIYARTYNSYNENETGVWSEWYQISGAGLDMPSKKFIDLLAPTSSGQIYTAPANGYYSIKSRGQSTSTYILFDVLNENSNYLYAMRMLSTNTGDCEQIIPISKNYKLRFIYNNTLDIQYFRFIYANSEVPMSER